MDATLEGLIDTINVALEAGNWQEVVALTVPLYSASVEAGDTVFAELVMDLHLIAQDALAFPLEVAQVLSP
jgi:hypothetical protein